MRQHRTSRKQTEHNDSGNEKRYPASEEYQSCTTRSEASPAETPSNQRVNAGHDEQCADDHEEQSRILDHK